MKTYQQSAVNAFRTTPFAELIDQIKNFLLKLRAIKTTPDMPERIRKEKYYAENVVDRLKSFPVRKLNQREKDAVRTLLPCIEAALNECLMRQPNKRAATVLQKAKDCCTA